MADIEKVYVYENWKSDEPHRIGTLYVEGAKGKEIISFEYDQLWQKRRKKTKTINRAGFFIG
ncbi:MAG: hypothetical protein ACI4DN_05820 [Lachnospiraceae bacterium]